MIFRELLVFTCVFILLCVFSTEVDGGKGLNLKCYDCLLPKPECDFHDDTKNPKKSCTESENYKQVPPIPKSFKVDDNDVICFKAEHKAGGGKTGRKTLGCAPAKVIDIETHKLVSFCDYWKKHMGKDDECSTCNKDLCNGQSKNSTSLLTILILLIIFLSINM